MPLPVSEASSSLPSWTLEEQGSARMPWGHRYFQASSVPNHPCVMGCMTWSPCHHAGNATVELAGSCMPTACALGWEGGGGGHRGRRRWKKVSRHLVSMLRGTRSCFSVVLGVSGLGGHHAPRAGCPPAWSEWVPVTPRMAWRRPETRLPWCWHEPNVCGLWVLLVFWLEELSQ